MELKREHLIKLLENIEVEQKNNANMMKVDLRLSAVYEELKKWEILTRKSWMGRKWFFIKTFPWWRKSFKMKVMSLPDETVFGYNYVVKPIGTEFRLIKIRVWVKKVKDPIPFSLTFSEPNYKLNDIINLAKK